MTWVKDTIKSIDFEGKAFAMSQPYSRWEVDEIIGQELYRNLLIAIICVLISSLILAWSTQPWFYEVTGFVFISLLFYNLHFSI